MPRRRPTPAPTATSPVLVDRVDAYLLARGLVVVEPDPAAPVVEAIPDRRLAAGLVALEADVFDRGHLLGADLRTALSALPLERLGEAGSALLARLDERLGAAQPHVPLFRNFPASTPHNTEKLWVERVLTLLLQEQEQPCVLCGAVGSVHAVRPCGHLVCDVCFDGSDYSACPICRRRIDLDDPFLRPAAARLRRRETKRSPLRRLSLAADRDASVRAELERLLRRSAAPSVSDLEGLSVLVDHAAERHPGDLSWLPRPIPARTAKAVVMARLLADVSTREATAARLGDQLDTATDVLRVAVVLVGGRADLTPTLDRMHNIARPARRALLSTLDRLPVNDAAEDVLRHVVQWKKVAEVLHPFEHARSHPFAALLVAAARETRLDTLDEPLRVALTGAAAQHPQTFAVADGRLRVTTWAGQVEAALREGRLADAIAACERRPGELFRRLDHLLSAAARAHPDQTAAVLEAAQGAVGRVAPAVLVSAYSELVGRGETGGERLFFPAGRVASAHAARDEREPLPAAVVAATSDLIEGELLRRAAGLPGFDLAVIDTALEDVPVPFAARTTSKAVVDLPRGTVLPLPQGDVLRLFLHWTEPLGTRVDLDLSVALYDADWSFVGLCDYTAMRFGGSAAVHSGDLTSAPAPLGATEFVDLDLLELEESGAVYAVPVVFSYNDVPFDQMEDAFAGLMVRTAEAARSGALFDARTVEQRFDLRGQARIAVPMVLDLPAGQLCWLDMNLGASGYGHDVRGYSARLAELTRSLLDHFKAGRRTTMWELGSWHAAARAPRVAVRSPSLTRWYVRGAEEPVLDFARRMSQPDCADETAPASTLAEGASPVLAALMVGDLVLPAGSSAYALFPDLVGLGDVTLLPGLDLLSALG